MQREIIKIKYKLQSFFPYFQKRHLINRLDSQFPQWSRQAVITVFRSTWMTSEINRVDEKKNRVWEYIYVSGRC